MANRFYINCPLRLGLITVQGPEAHHLATVCRFRPGDRVCLFNGDGHEYVASVASVARQSVTVDIVAVETPLRESEVRIDVAAPVPKGDRAQFLLEKLTELGVRTFIPLRTQRSVVHPRETKLDRLQRTVIEASKQCGRNILLRVEPLVDWNEYCRRDDLPSVRVVAHPGEGSDAYPLTLPSPPAAGGEGRVRGCGELEIALAVGPEGGFTDEEIELARVHRWQVVSLGPRILRIETAALVLAAWATGLPCRRGCA